MKVNIFTTVADDGPNMEEEIKQVVIVLQFTRYKVISA